MDMFFILLKQCATMFLLILCGFILRKKKMMSNQGVKDMSSVLLYVATPAILINPFLNSSEGFGAIILESGILTLACLFACIIISYLIFRKNIIGRFACIFTNCGFMGIPLVISLFGNSGISNLSMYIIISNITFWTLGAYMMSGSKDELQIKKIIFNPCIIAFICGLLIFLLNINVGEVVINVFNTLGNLNTPLAMIILGTYVADCDFKTLFATKSSYVVCFVRLIIIPLVTILILMLIPYGSLTTKLVVFIAMSTPCASNTGIFSQMFNRDYKLASSYVCLSTLFSLITLPILVPLVNTLIMKI